MESKYLIVPYIIWLIISSIVLFYVAYYMHKINADINQIETKVDNIYTILEEWELTK
jgi:fucose 4-O-acetylase-like acetyltransferase